ncbi:hypothetical protein E6W39_08055 [Kitasatospora acidiphila]|uniref:Uncharacterized protein n=1 Tax=Kitasatospora acidiphila TaxID=2567942 RepID=A0A540VZN7_9ACTN|nr:hypothetical protein [Kitasatospora acidiphila]TQF02232.1 hypothetical protein E6W39_08055 [Kitasatospora acidiphila]
MRTSRSSATWPARSCWTSWTERPPLNDPVSAAIRIIGGVPLVALGISTLYSRRAARGRAGEATPTAPSTEAGPRTGFWTGYLLGLTTNLGNPEAGVFAVSVLPQFVTTNGPVLLSRLALGGSGPW